MRVRNGSTLIALAASLACALSIAADDLRTLNERATQLLREKRAAEAAALYAAAPRPVDPDELTNFLYSAAVVAAEAGDEAAARERLLEVVERDALFGPSADLLVALLAKAPPADTVDVWPRAAIALARGGLAGRAEEILTNALRCEPEVARVWPRALIGVLAEQSTMPPDIRRTWAPRVRASGCAALAAFAERIEALDGSNEEVIKTAARSLEAEGVADRAAIVKLLETLTQRDLAAQNDAGAYGRAMAALALDPAATRAALGAAQALASTRRLGDPERLLKAVQASQFTDAERPVFFAQLAEAFDMRSRTAEAEAAYRSAAASLTADSPAMPNVRRKVAEIQVRAGDHAGARASYKAAFDQYTDAGDTRSAYATVREAVRNKALSPEVATQWAIGLGNLQELEIDRGIRASAMKLLPSLFEGEAPIDRPEKRAWTIDGSLTKADSAGGVTPAVDARRFAAWFEAPVIEREPTEQHDFRVRLWHDQFEGERSIAGIPADVGERSTHASVIVDHGYWSGGLAFDGHRSTDTAFGASGGRSGDATWLHEDWSKALMVRMEARVRGRLIIETTGRRREISSQDDPRATGAPAAIVDAAGVRRGTWRIHDDAAQSKELSVRGTFFATPTISLHAAAGSNRTHQTHGGTMAGRNTETAARELVNANAEVSLVRFYRTSEYAAQRLAESFAAGAAYHGLWLDAYAALRTRFERSSIQARPAAANPVRPDLLPALPSSAGPVVSWTALSPVIGASAHLGGSRISLSIRRDALPMPDGVQEFANRNVLSAIDATFVDFDRDGLVGERERESVRPIASYGVNSLRSIDVEAPRRDGIEVSWSRRLLGGELAVTGALARERGLFETRPLVAEGSGPARPAVRADYAPDAATGAYRLRSGLRSSGYLLENSERGRDVRTAELQWSRQVYTTAAKVRARIHHDVWRMGERYAAEHDPTPLAQSYDRWGFLRGGRDGGAAADGFAGDHEVALAIPNGRWEAALELSRSFGRYRTGVVVTSRDGPAVSPFRRVIGGDGIERFVSTGQERLPVFTNADVFIERQFRRSTVRLECLHCAGDPVAMRRFNQQNAPRANVVEETTEGRIVLVGLHWQRHRN